MIQLPKILPQPEQRPFELPLSAKWLAGEGAGSWFQFEQIDGKSNYSISRFSPNGIFECKAIFEANIHFNPNTDFEITYPSHCGLVTVIQESKRISFTAV